MIFKILKQITTITTFLSICQGRGDGCLSPTFRVAMLIARPHIFRYSSVIVIKQQSTKYPMFLSPLHAAPFL